MINFGPGLALASLKRGAVSRLAGDQPAGRVASLSHFIMVGGTSGSSGDIPRNLRVGVPMLRAAFPTVARSASWMSSLKFQLGDLPPECVDALARV
jgi:hypothetical protein